jgi:hypothetical protein
MATRTSLDTDWIGSWVRRYWLAVWFIVISAIAVAQLVMAGFSPTGDADLYLVATRRWLQGGDPWSTPVGDWWFGAPPPTLLAMAPFALLPAPIGPWVVLATTIAAGILTIRLLALPWWWIAFPPLLLSMFGNPQAWLVPLLVGGAGWLAPIIKIYAAPVLLLLARWRDLAIAGLVLLVTAPFLPWASYVSQFGAISEHLAAQSGQFSTFGNPWLMAVAVAALILVGRERAAWLVTPALWPSTQWYYDSLAVPALLPLSAAVLAVPVPGMIAVALVVMVVEVRRSQPAPGPLPEASPAG